MELPYDVNFLSGSCCAIQKPICVSFFDPARQLKTIYKNFMRFAPTDFRGMFDTQRAIIKKTTQIDYVLRKENEDNHSFSFRKA